MITMTTGSTSLGLSAWSSATPPTQLFLLIIPLQDIAYRYVRRLVIWYGLVQCFISFGMANNRFSIDALLCDAHFTLFRPPAPILRLGRFTRWMNFWKNPFRILRCGFWPLNNAREERKHQIFKLPFCSLSPLSILTFSSATLSWTSDHSWKIP